MKKVGISFIILGALLFFMMSGVLADSTNTSSTQQVQNAYSCLNSQITTKTCSSLSASEQIFSLLATGKCKDALMANSDSGKCWPKGNCNVKTTAQAVMALNKAGVNTTAAVSWLNQTLISPTNLIWYLEIQNENISKCTLSYSNHSYNIIMNSDKTISGNPGSCFSYSDSPYWLRVAPNCVNKDFTVSCNTSFLTTFLFRQNNEQTIHVTDSVLSSSANGETNNKINSYCFSNNNQCNYEGTLWGSLVFSILNEDTKRFLPYIKTQINSRYIPGAFLYALTGNPQYQTQIVNLQINNKYWKVSNDKYYDTALALLPFQSQDFPEKSSAENYLLSVQGSNGCWDNSNILDTAFILASVWPKENTNNNNGGDQTPDNSCLLSNYYCTSSSSCTGETLPAYSCPGATQICCTEEQKQDCPTDEICTASTQQCIGGSETYTSNLVSGQVCCSGGSCVAKSTQTPTKENDTCTPANGTCSSSCSSGYTQSSSYTCQNGEICCFPKQKSSSKLLLIIILGILIILAIIGIIKKNELKKFFDSKFGKGSNAPTSSRNPPRPPSYPSNYRPRTVESFRRPVVPIPPRKIISPRNSLQKSALPRRQIKQLPQKPRPKSPKELEEVLRKLKEMSD